MNCSLCGKEIVFVAGDWYHVDSELVDARFCRSEHNDDEIAQPEQGNGKEFGRQGF